MSDDAVAAGTPASASTAVASVLSVQGLAKAYGPTQALRSASLSLAPGEVHAVIGENGSGKSTMVKILTGIVRPDRGTLEMGGVPIGPLHGPRSALRAGIVAVFQNVLMVPERSVLDNVWLGSDGLIRRGVREKVRRARATEMLHELLEEVPDLDASAGSLPLSVRQTCGIARAMLREPKILILDEATSALDVATRDRLFTLLRRMAASGRAVIFISHRMDEIGEIGDVVTVMRAGSTVATLKRGEAEPGELIRLMIGTEHLAERALLDDRSKRVRADEVVLSARGVIVREDAAPLELAVYAGEIIGVGGLDGHGQDRLLQVLAGDAADAGDEAGGEIRVHQGDYSTVVRSRVHATALGVVYVPRDRQTAGTFETLSIRDNFALPTLTRDLKAGLISHRATRRRFASYVDSLKIKLADQRLSISTLSGGNQQKVIIARWLAVNPRVLLLNDPTRGIDPGAKHDLYELLSSLASTGVAVVMLSTDVDELLDLMDRVLVFREGQLYTEIAKEQLTRHELVSSFFGRRGAYE
ncbi:MAG TPA: sugar ABC transporter ATP-binding protein [Solirubrobacteraceae bacterium]|jgi:ABC-type sugar transport system ATPase subunit